MKLFDNTEAQARYEAVAPIVDGYEQATRLWGQVTTQELLSETLSALRRVPEAIRAEVEAIANGMLRDEFIRIAAAHFSDAERIRDPGFSLNVMTHSAKLAVFSAVGYLAGSAWHLADAALLKRMAIDLRTSNSFDCVLKHLQSVPCINLFVAALETDDRDCYLKSVKELVRRHKVNNLVFDGELIEWMPEFEFLSACTEVGIRPVHVGIANRKGATKHSMLRPETTPQRIPPLFVDSQGRQLTQSNADEVLLPAAARPEPVARPDQPVPHSAARVVVQPVEAPDGAAPSSAMQSRIQALRANQVRRTARP